MVVERGSDFRSDPSSIGELPQVVSHFPTSVGEYFEQVREAGLVRGGFDLVQIGTDGIEAYWAEKRLKWELETPDFLDETLGEGDEAPNVVFLPGFLAWKGREIEGLPWQIRGTYDSTFQRLESRGARVYPIFPSSGFNDASVEETVEKAAQTVREIDSSSDGPISLVGHSLGGETEYLFAARYPDLVSKVRHFVTAGSPLPVWVNNLIKGALLVLRNPKEARLITEMIEFLSSKESEGFKGKLQSIISERDCVLKGPSPSSVTTVGPGHSSLFFNSGVISEISAIIKS